MRVYPKNLIYRIIKLKIRVHIRGALLAFVLGACTYNVLDVKTEKFNYMYKSICRKGKFQINPSL